MKIGSTKRIIFSLSIVIFFFYPQINKAQIFVDSNNLSGIEDGSLIHPFNTVTEGITAAQTNDTIFISEGIYSVGETFPILLKPGITLLGENSDDTIIQNNLYMYTWGESEIISVNNLTVDGITITRRTPKTEPIGNNSIRNCIINKNLNVVFWGIHNFILEDNEIRGGLGFIAMRDSLNRFRTDVNIISGCMIDSSIEIAQVGDHLIQISDCEISKNIYFQGSTGGQVSEPDIVITDNYIGNNIYVKASGIASFISGNQINNGINLKISGKGKSQTIIDNEITTNSDSIIGISGTIASSPILIEGNMILIPGKSFAVSLVSSDSVKILDNSIDGGKAGIGYIGTKCLITGNTITNADTGLHLFGSSLICNENSILNCSQVGIFSEGLGKFNNNIISNCGTGIIEKAGDFFNNTVFNSKADGIVSTTTGTFGYNNIVGNKGAGIRIQYYSDLGGGYYKSPGNNKIKDNGTYDVLIESTGDSTIYAENNFWDHQAEADINQFDIYDKSDNSVLSKVDFIPFNSVPIPPTLLSPLNNEKDISTQVNLIWQKSYGSDYFRLQLSKDSVFTSLEMDTSGISDTTIRILSLTSLTKYYWRVSATNLFGESGWSKVCSFTTKGITSIDSKTEIPKEFNLYQNYPNPFNPSTTICYQLPVDSKVTLKLFNSLGQEVETLVDVNQNTGYHSSLYTLNSSLPSGIYFYQLRTGSPKGQAFIQTKKMILTK